jgi:hypothetical protein
VSISPFLLCLFLSLSSSLAHLYQLFLLLSRNLPLLIFVATIFTLGSGSLAWHYVRLPHALHLASFNALLIVRPSHYVLQMQDDQRGFTNQMATNKDLVCLIFRTASVLSPERIELIEFVHGM